LAIFWLAKRFRLSAESLSQIEFNTIRVSENVDVIVLQTQEGSSLFSSSGQSPPLMIVPHGMSKSYKVLIDPLSSEGHLLGGPHTAFSMDYVPSRLAFVLCGIHVALGNLGLSLSRMTMTHPIYLFIIVNYRGSTGYGQDSIQSLLGKIGDQDVQDCYVGG
jgi:hypothetical protein